MAVTAFLPTHLIVNFRGSAFTIFTIPEGRFDSEQIKRLKGELPPALDEDKGYAIKHLSLRISIVPPEYQIVECLYNEGSLDHAVIAEDLQLISGLVAVAAAKVILQEKEADPFSKGKGETVSIEFFEKKFLEGWMIELDNKERAIKDVIVFLDMFYFNLCTRMEESAELARIIKTELLDVCSCIDQFRCVLCTWFLSYIGEHLKKKSTKEASAVIEELFKEIKEKVREQLFLSEKITLALIKCLRPWFEREPKEAIINDINKALAPVKSCVRIENFLLAMLERYKVEKVRRCSILDLFPTLRSSGVYDGLALDETKPSVQRDFVRKKRKTLEERLSRTLSLEGSLFRSDKTHDLEGEFLAFLSQLKLPEEKGRTYQGMNESYEDLLRFPHRLEKDELTPYAFGAHHTIGRREAMQDVHYYDVLSINGTSVVAFGVFDGHGDYGKEAAVYAREQIGFYLVFCLTEASKGKNLKDLDPYTLEQALTLACLFTNQKMSKTYPKDFWTSGTTLVLSLIIGDISWTMCVGDSRALIIDRDGSIRQLSQDAVGADPTYAKSAEKRGGKLTPDHGIIRTDGMGPARSFGDFFSLATPARPKITRHQLKASKEGEESTPPALFLGCDGIFDVLSSKEVGNLIKKLMAMGKSPQECAQLSCKLAYYKESHDNLTALVVYL